MDRRTIKSLEKRLSVLEEYINTPKNENEVEDTKAALYDLIAYMDKVERNNDKFFVPLFEEKELRNKFYKLYTVQIVVPNDFGVNQYN